jgi:PAS domain S-box-containing protein
MVPSRILIVEDEHIAAELLGEMLRSMGHSVCGTAAFGEDAISNAEETRPDLILMDINLRGTMNGVEAAEKIQELLDIPVVYLTAHTDMETVQQAKLTTPFGFIQKPYRMGELRSAIEIALYRHDMEQRLKEREHSYRMLADNLPGILYRLSPAGGQPQFFNNMLFTMTGYTAAELLLNMTCPLQSLIIPEDQQTVTGKFKEALEQNVPFEIEYRIRHKNGDIRYVNDCGRPSRNGGASPVHIDGMIFDITERKRFEEELQKASKALEERKTFFESILSNNESGILVTDLNMKILLANPYVQRLYEKGADDFLGKNLWDLCPEIHGRITAGIDADEIAIHCGRKEMIIGFSRFNLKGVDRAVVGHIINFKDLSEMVRIRQEMRQKERLSTMGEVVARVAHEMRNPLFGMTAVGQIIDMELDLSPAHKQLIESFLKEARRLNNLVEELLDCTRELRLRKKKANLLKVIDVSIRANHALAHEKKITIEKSYPEKGIHLMIDPEKIEQVILNLLKNAIDASEEGSTIGVRVHADEARAFVEVRDSGHGIPEELVDKIFDFFYTTKRHGTGMGLAISKNIVIAHGGNLVARNNSDQGATFTLILPLEGEES